MSFSWLHYRSSVAILFYIFLNALLVEIVFLLWTSDVPTFSQALANGLLQYAVLLTIQYLAGVCSCLFLRQSCSPLGWWVLAVASIGSVRPGILVLGTRGLHNEWL